MIRNLTIYTIGNISRHAAALLMLPVYTRFLTPADYGTVELITVITASFSLVFGFQMSDTLFRFYKGQKEKIVRDDVVPTAMWLSLALGFIAVALLVLSAPYISARLSELEDFRFLLSLFGFSILLEAAAAIPLTQMRADDKAGLFTTINIARLVIQVLLSIVLVALMGLAVKGVIIANLVSAGLVAVAVIPYTVKTHGIAFDLKKAHMMLKFGGPLAVGNIAAFLVTFGDRLFLAQFQPTSAVGIYALAFRFASVVRILVAVPFQQMWEAIQYHIASDPGGRKILHGVFLTFGTGIILAATLLSIGAKPIVEVLATEPYFDAIELIPILSFAAALNGLAIFARLGIMVRKKTVYIALNSWLVAAFLVVMLLWLTPIYGAKGTAIALLTSGMVRFAIDYGISWFVWDMTLPIGRLVLVTVLSVIAISVSSLVSSSLVLDVFIRCGIVLALLGLVWLLPILPANTKRSMRTFIGNLTTNQHSKLEKNVEE